MGSDRFGICALALALLASAPATHAADAPLADAAERSDRGEVRALIERRVDVNQAQNDGMTALHWAAHRDDLETAKLLVGAGADVKAANRYGVTPLSLACNNGDEAMVELLLGAGADPNARLRGGETALMTAARTGKLGPVKALLARGADVDAKEKRGQTALMWAAAEGHAGVVEALLGAGSDFRTPLPSGYTPLFFAVREGRADVVRVLLKAGADVNGAMQPEKSPGRAPARGTAPLILAVENGHFEVAVALLEAGADPNDQRSGFTPLHTLTWVRKPNRGDDESGDPAPAGSGSLTSLQFVEKLVERGADVNARLKRGASGRGVLGRAGASPFLLAAMTADVPLMRALVEHGADPLLPNAKRSTPLMAAAGVGTLAPGEEAGTEPEALEAVALALELGGDVNAVDDNGETAMHGAAYKSLPKMVQLLADKGARVEVWNRKNKYGWTPLSIAEGHRPGNFKPSPETIAALHRVMRSAGISPPKGDAPIEDRKGYPPGAAGATSTNPKSTEPAGDSAEPPVIPVGYDAFTQWERWPYLRLGVRASMRSTFDRTGGNRNADAAHFLRQEGDDRNVVLDEAGPGVLWFVRHNHWHGSPWTYRVDGRETVVAESSTADPTRPVAGSVFLPERLFPKGLTWTWSETKGADLSWVPIPFERSLQIDYGRARYGTGYFILWKVMPGLANLSRPLKGWTDADVPPAEVLDLLARSGTDIAPKGDGVALRRGTLALGPYETKTVLRLDGADAPAVIRRLAFRVAERGAEALAKSRLRITWDDRPEPSVDAPVGLFFGTGSLMRTPGRDSIVKSFPMTVERTSAEARFATYFPMPFHRSARVELANPGGEAIEGGEWEARTVPYRDPANWVGLFHATYRDFPRPEPGRDLVLLDTREAEGGGDWCGHLVGTTYLFTKTGDLTTLEGDPRFFFDDSPSPQAQGTGSEEWGGGDYWGGLTMTLPFAGHPVGRPPDQSTTPEDRVHSAYRFLLTDLMPFGRNARITLEHGGVNDSREHYETVTYWYGVDRPGLVRTDEIDVGDPADERRHDYRSPDATEPRALVSRHELGVDHAPIRGGRGTAEVFPPVADDGRSTATHSEFTIGLTRANLGVLLRRRLDLAVPDQRARVLVSDADGPPLWREAGTWYTAGGNSVVFGDPLAIPEAKRTAHPEVSPPAHEVVTSNRRWREDEFLVPRKLTEGRERVRVRIEHAPIVRPLLTGRPPAEPSWTEYRYWADCFLMPRTEGPADWVEALDPRLSALRRESSGEGRSWKTAEDFRPVAAGDVVLDATTARARGTARVIDDPSASSGLALRFEGPGHPGPVAEPEGAADFAFEAPEGRYTVFLRGKAAGGLQGDAAWLQIDDEVGTDRGPRVEMGFGNWRDRYPPGAYAWSSRLPQAEPVAVDLRGSGAHRLRLQARQAPFAVDQVWLARDRDRTPEFVVPVAKGRREGRGP